MELLGHKVDLKTLLRDPYPEIIPRVVPSSWLSLVPSSWKAGVLFLRSSLFAGEKVSYKTMVQATIMLLLRAGGVWVSVRNR